MDQRYTDRPCMCCTYFQIADFGLSKKLADDTEYYMTSGGMVPVKWTAPEVFTVTSLTVRVWSYNCE